MARIEPLISAMQRFGAGGLILQSEQSVVLRFPDGDKAARQVVTHADVTAIIEEVAPFSLQAQLRSGRGARFETVIGGAPFQVSIEGNANAWRVTILPYGGMPAAPAAPSAPTPAAPSHGGAPSPAQPAPARAQTAPVAGSPVASAAGTAPASPASPAAPAASAGPAAPQGRFAAMAAAAKNMASVVAGTNKPQGAPPPKPLFDAENRVEQQSVDVPRVQVATRITPDWIAEFLTIASRARASDVVVSPSSGLRLRVFGTLYEVSEKLDEKQTAQIAEAAMTPVARERFRTEHEVDFAYALHGYGRFRVNVFRQQRGVSVVFHFLPETPPTLQRLGLPDSLSKITTFHQGLVLLTGPAGCGKSSSMAALVDLINDDRNDHILTIEDPIEFIHRPKKCVVNQREVKRDTTTFARALRAALREDPDVICIGELRDLETISLAMSAAETGHLVLGTLHTNSAIRTINRLIGAYPASQHGQVRNMLSESLRAVVSQRLLPRADGKGMALALELMFNTRAIANLIRENRTIQISSALQTGKNHGQILLDHSLIELAKAGTVTLEAAALHSEKPEQFRI